MAHAPGWVRPGKCARLAQTVSPFRREKLLSLHPQVGLVWRHSSLPPAGDIPTRSRWQDIRTSAMPKNPARPDATSGEVWRWRRVDHQGLEPSSQALWQGFSNAIREFTLALHCDA